MKPDPRATWYRLATRAGVGAIALVTMLSGCTSADPARDAIRPSQAAAHSTAGSVLAGSETAGSEIASSAPTGPHPTQSLLGAPAKQAGVGAAATLPFPGDALLTPPVQRSTRDRVITSTIAVDSGLSLADGWYHSTDSWSSETPPPPTVTNEARSSVYGLEPGLVVAYQIRDGGQPTDVWIGAKFFSPIWGSNAWECVVYHGNPRAGGRPDDATQYSCEWSDYRGVNPGPRLTIARWSGTGPVFPGDADLSQQQPKQPRSDTLEGGEIKINSGHLGDGWFAPTDRWSSVMAPPLTIVAKSPGNFVLEGVNPGMVAAYQIYGSSGRPTGVWIGAKLYLPSMWELRKGWECRLYVGDPRITGRVTVTSPYSCVWTPGTDAHPNWILTVSGVQ